ncbi:MAG: Asp-tRNA(Asn)/Glu-tRNA(Gln) amidotransferase subunit GatC [Candidatus Aenigmarchaeota archaeon]|nr:Asp-tRNA(Asn)/Glu-tRNA(Gln) amidotransferase subunit GatC [Candidatus Aenigmarchaeota archaeon]
MKVTPDIVRRVAKIARLDLTEAEVKKFSKDLNEILAAFKELDKAKANVEPSFQPLEIKDVTREDKPEDVLSQEAALSNTKHKEKGFFKGPRAV